MRRSISEFKGKGNRLSHKEFQEKKIKNKVILVVQITLLTNIPLISRAPFSPDHIRSPFTFVRGVFFIDTDGHYGIRLYLLCLVEQSTHSLSWLSAAFAPDFCVPWMAVECLQALENTEVWPANILHLHSFVKEHLKSNGIYCNFIPIGSKCQCSLLWYLPSFLI